MNTKSFFLNGPFPTSFLYFRLFYKQLTVIKCSIKVADDWIQTRVLWYCKRPLCQLRHNHFPRTQKVYHYLHLVTQTNFPNDQSKISPLIAFPEIHSKIGVRKLTIIEYISIQLSVHRKFLLQWYIDLGQMLPKKISKFVHLKSLIK